MKPAVIAALFLATSAFSQPQAPVKQRNEPNEGRRLALLVGIQNYNKLPLLPGTKTALDLIQPALVGAGFAVTRVPDVGYADLKDALDKFVSEVHEGDTCFFYFSGYEVQNDDDDYLLPKDFDPTAEKISPKAAYPVTAFAINLEDKKARIKIFFLEGARSFDSNLSNAAPGLRIPFTGDVREWLFAMPNLVKPTVDTSADQPGLLTKALVEVIQSEKSLAEGMAQILKTVRGQSNYRQQPMWIPGVDEDFYFHPPHVRTQNQKDREFYVWIRPGKFLMGCVPGVKCESDEEPRHEVTLTKGFWMAENEVRVVSYQKFIDASPSGKKVRKMPTSYRENPKWRNEEHPIANMTWEDAQGYCSWVGGRLPTEAEWERAARGFRDNQVYPFDSLEESRGKANFFGKQGNDDYEYTAPVQKFDKNDFGLFDMSGNVWELVSDFFEKYSADPVVDPKGPDSGKHHVMRGGSYDSDPKTHLRISFREPSKEPWPNIGFRCVLDDSPQTRQILQIP